MRRSSEEASPGMKQVTSIEKLLSNFEDELGLEDEDDGFLKPLKPRKSIEQRLSIVHEVNMIRTRSLAFRQSVDERNSWLSH